MKKIFFAALAALCLMTACDDTTDTLGSSLTNNADNLKITVDTFEITTRSIKVDSVLNRSTNGYFGRVLDPETGVYYTGDFLTQFSVLENFNLFDEGEHFNVTDDDENSLCTNAEDHLCSYAQLRLYINSFYGDSLTALKATVMEMQKPMEESQKYYSNFDPQTKGYLRADGLKAHASFSITDRNYSDSVRGLSTWQNSINIPLNTPYTDKNGVKYNNIGSYILKMYRDHKEYFKNSYMLNHYVFPGLYVKYAGGLGAMAKIGTTELNLRYNATIKVNGKDSVMNIWTSFTGTDEVIQSTRLSNDDEKINSLVAETNHTYIKTPASIFTEVEMPIHNIFMGHEADTLNSAKVTFQCINAENTDSKYKFGIPQTLLIVQKDSLDSFFDNAKLANYRNTFLATYSSTSNCYTFNNISSLIQTMRAAYQKGIASDAQWEMKNPNWNKLVLVPVNAIYTTYSSSSVLSNITHDLSLSSVKLVGGENNDHQPIKMSVIFSKFNQ